MSACCAVSAVTAGGGGRESAAGRGVRSMAGTVVPGVVLALLPKCPVCLAGYVAMASGVGISVSAAAGLRLGVMSACVGLVIAFGARTLRSFGTNVRSRR